MELLLLILAAGVVGYLLAGSRFSKPIDDTTEKVADATRRTAGNVESWFSRTFRSGKKPKEEVVEAQAKSAEPATAEAKPAARQTSRRRGEEVEDDKA